MAIRHLKRGSRAQTPTGAVDDALLAGLRARDPVAFEQFYLDFAGPIYNICLRILRSAEDAEDVTQEVFIKAHQRLPGCADGFRLKAWLNRVAVNACYDHLRLRRAHVDLDTVTDMPSPAGPDSFEQAELSQVLEQTLGSLSVDHRTVLLLKDVQGLTQGEIAGVLGVSHSATEARLFRARGAFRRAYSELTRPWQRPRCDVARQAAVESVGRGFNERQRRRVLGHAETCPDCGETVKGWGVASAGLAVLLPQVPLPAGLLASPFAALGAAAAGAAGAGAAAGGGVAGGALAGSSVATAGVTGAGAAAAGATGAVTGAAVTAGALAAKVAVVVIVAGALATTAGQTAQRITAAHAHGRAATPAASRGVAGDRAAASTTEDRGAGQGHQRSAVGRSRGAHGAKAGPGTTRRGVKSAGQTARRAGNGAGAGAVHGNVAPGKAASVHGTSASARGAAASADGRARASSSKLKPGPHLGSQALSGPADPASGGRAGADKPEHAAEPTLPQGP